MASYLDFISSYPYRRGRPNPTNDGRGSGRGRSYRTSMNSASGLTISRWDRPESREARMSDQLIEAQPFDFIKGAIEDCCRAIAAARAQRWEVEKWAVAESR